MTLKIDIQILEKTISKEMVDNKHIINTPKTNKSIRQVKLDNKLISKLNKLKEFYKGIVNFNDDQFIFGGLNPLSPSTIGRKKEQAMYRLIPI